MKKLKGKNPKARRRNPPSARNPIRWLAAIIAICAIGPASRGFCADPSDPILDLMLQKGLITEDEAVKVKAEAEAIRTNEVSQFPESRFKISPAIKDME